MLSRFDLLPYLFSLSDLGTFPPLNNSTAFLNLEDCRLYSRLFFPQQENMRPSELITSVCWGLLPLSNLAVAQFPPEPEGIKVLRSKFDNNVTISYKEV